MKRIFILSSLLILFSFSLYAEEAIEQIYTGNRGFIYSNPDIPEKKLKETKRFIIKISPIKRPKPRVYPESKRPPEKIKIIKELPSLKSEEEIESKKTEREILLEKEIISLKKRLKEANKQLLLANQKIKELKEKTYKKPYITQTYIVQKGDCLWSIAGKKEVYADPYKWLLLYHANKDQIRNPNLIYPNMVLIIPRLEEYEKEK